MFNLHKTNIQEGVHSMFTHNNIGTIGQIFTTAHPKSGTFRLYFRHCND